MILIDANLLLYATVADYPQHQIARPWLEDVFNGSGPVGLPWPSLLAFVRIITNPKVFQRPIPIHEAWAFVESWLALATVWTPLPTPRHAQILGTLLENSHSRGNLVPDAHLAALSIEHHLTLFSADGDFSRFPGLTWRNPLSD